VEAHTVVSRRGSHIFETVGSQMAVTLIVFTDYVNTRAIVRLEGLVQLRNLIELATLRLGYVHIMIP
jgi:hypothetical protein